MNQKKLKFLFLGSSSIDQMHLCDVKFSQYFYDHFLNETNWISSGHVRTQSSVMVTRGFSLALQLDETKTPDCKMDSLDSEDSNTWDLHDVTQSAQSESKRFRKIFRLT